MSHKEYTRTRLLRAIDSGLFWEKLPHFDPTINCADWHQLYPKLQALGFNVRIMMLPMSLWQAIVSDPSGANFMGRANTIEMALTIAVTRALENNDN